MRIGLHRPVPWREPALGAVTEFLESRGVAYTTWDGWDRLDAHEMSLGAAYGELPDGKVRERVKVVDRQTMIDLSRG